MTAPRQLADAHLELVGQAVDRVWPGAEWTAEPLEDAMTNRNFKVVVTPTGGEPRVVVVQEQLPVEMAYAIGIIRANQMTIWPEVTELGLAPQLLGAFDDIGVTVVEFVEGIRLSEVEDRELAIRLTGETLRRLHDHTRGVATPGLVSDPFEGMAWLAGRIRDEAPAMFDDFRWAMELVERIHAARGPYERCQVHTDATHLNIILAPGRDRITLIDWEFVGAGDGYLDVAHFAARAGLTEAEEELLVRAYQGHDDERALALVRVYRFISMLREGLWSALADRIGFLDEFDHVEYARECLDRMAMTAQSDTFKKALSVLEARPA
jgi:thiamine kinase-like enzyme